MEKKQIRRRRLSIRGIAHERLTHYLFRYPAKFHPPVAKALLRAYTYERQVVLDPFCGSGTLLLEAGVERRHSIGVDIDPVAVAVTSAKVHRYRPSDLANSIDLLIERVNRFERSAGEYERRMFEDLAQTTFRRQVSTLRHYVPEIPNLEHWFRRYVVVDLARILREIDRLHAPRSHKALFKIVFASIIRNASNADPVPVSGLEVTAHMRQRDLKGRLVNPFALFEKALVSALHSATEWYGASASDISSKVYHGDALNVSRHVRQQVDAVITSPPYHGAVEYYRRHKLEMFWLQHVMSQDDSIALTSRYIGRPTVPKSDARLREGCLENGLARAWEERIREISPGRADAFRHYMVSMRGVFSSLRSVLRPSSPAILVVGHSSWNGAQIPTTRLFKEIAAPFFSLDEVLSYPIRNRYMSYARRNNASIAVEHVLVFHRTRVGT